MANASIDLWSSKNYYLLSSTGYLTFNNAYNFNQNNCLLDSEKCYKSNFLSSDGIKLYCSKGCQNTSSIFSSCLNSVGENGDIYIRAWNSACLTNPDDKSKICVVERINLLNSEGYNPATVLTTSGVGPISCDSCTRASMLDMINNYNYIQSLPALRSLDVNYTNITNNQNNIMSVCHQSYAQLGLAALNTTPLLSTTDIVLIVLGVVLVLVLITGLCCCIWKKKKNKLINRNNPSGGFRLPENTSPSSNNTYVNTQSTIDEIPLVDSQYDAYRMTSKFL